MTAAEREASRRAAQRRQRRKAAPVGFKLSASGARFGLFTWHYLIQTKGGRFAGQPLALELYQLEVMSDLLRVEREAWLELTLQDLENIGGTYSDRRAFWSRVHDWRSDAETSGRRVHREGLLGIPKKNGKSTMASGLALYLLVADGEPGAEVYSTASAKDQARIVFRSAREMVEASGRLLERVQLYRDRIGYAELDAFYQALSADAGVQEGINPHGVINDEVHAQPSRDLYDTLRSATIARDEPLLFSITTAGVSLKAKDGALTIGGDLYTRGAGPRPKYATLKIGGEAFSIVKPRDGKPRSFYFRWYEVPWRHRENPAWWKRANPAPWITLEKLQDESDLERPRGIFYRYHANIWSRVEKHWLRPDWWAAARAPDLGIAAGDSVVLTYDVGLSYDTTALSVFRVPTDDQPRPVLRCFVWGVHDNPKAPPPPAHKLLDEGPISLDTIEETARAIATGTLEPEIREALGLPDAPLDVVAVGADPHKFETQLQHLDASGFEVFRFDQGPLMTKASEVLYRLLSPKAPDQLAHNGDPVTEAHFENAIARDVGNGRWRLDKKNATEKMDAAVSSAMGAYMIGDEEIVSRGRPSFGLL